MFGVIRGRFFVYKEKIQTYVWNAHVWNVGSMIECFIYDYRDITEEKRKDINDIGFDLVLVDGNPVVYKEFSSLEEAIEKNDEYKLKKKRKKRYSLWLFKNINLSDIESFYRIDPYLRIYGMTFRFTKTKYFKEDGEYFRDKFQISDDNLTEDEIFILKSEGCVFTTDIPANRGERFQEMSCLVPFDAIDGFVIEKKYLDINDYGEIEPKETGEKEVYFLDAKNPDPELWNMLKAHGLIYDMVPYDYRF